MNVKFNKIRLLFAVTFATLCSGLTACDAGFQTMGAGEHGVVFSALPRFLGGGVSNTVIEPGGKVLIYPWQTLYRVDTSVQSVGWGGVGQGDRPGIEDFVETRALDGNEVGLAMSVRYHVIPEKIPYIIQHVAVTDTGIRRLVSVVARADIRTHMNALETRQLIDPAQRDAMVNRVKDALSNRLEKEGIFIEAVIHHSHRFERRLPDGTMDSSYQEQIDQAQALEQQTQQEKKKILTVQKQKEQELNEARSGVNRMIEEAKGFKTQAENRGEGYFKAKQNEAEQILALGTAEVEGLKKQIAALSGPGGKALLRLAVAKALIAKQPKFVVLNSAGGEKGGIDINKVDSNELLRQAGIFSALSDTPKSGTYNSPKTNLEASEPEVKSLPKQLKSTK